MSFALMQTAPGGGLALPPSSPTSAFQARSVSSKIDRLMSLCWFFNLPSSSSQASLQSKQRCPLSKEACQEPWRSHLQAVPLFQLAEVGRGLRDSGDEPLALLSI